ncbi:hypothetical protein AL036_22640 [Salipiger aestuarii]|nr:hypothetical protein AL036_22640 [Salipiger aestuarii]
MQNLDETAQSFGNMNASIPPALAEALRDAIISAGIGEIPGPMRRFFVSAAMAMEDAEEFRNYMPVAFNATFNSKPLIEGELRKYGTLLSDSGLSLEICEEAVESSRRKLDDLANTPVPDDLTKRKLQVHAERIIARVRDEVPAAWHRG